MTREPDPRPGEPDGGELLRASQQGDPVAVEVLLARYYGLVRAFVRLRVDPATRLRESVSDLVQSVCREVISRAEQFEYRGEAAFRAWLCEAALRKLRDRRDHHHAQRRDPGREEAHDSADLADAYRTTLDPLGRAIRAEEIGRLECAVDALPDEQREALALRHVCGMSYAEIAAQTGRKEEAVRKLVSRARARLAESLSSDTRDP